jgi:hypothetical protein
MMRADSGAGQEGQASRAQEARFVRSSGLYRTHTGGHANRYQLFVERALSLLRPGGRLGLVAPMGLAIDHGSAALRRHLLSRADVDTLIDFENRRAIFPIHRGVRFLLATATAGRTTAAVRCRFLERDAGVLDTLGDSAEDDPPAALPVTLTPAFLRRVSGEEYTIPELRSATDLALFDKLTAAAPAFGDPSGWAADLGRELNASDDRAHCRAPTPGDRLLPVLDGKHVTPFRVDLDGPTRGLDRLAAARLLDGARTFGRPRLAWRDVASSSNRLTLIAAVVPAGAVTTHTLFCLRSDLDARVQAYLCGVLNSFVANYLVRPRVSTHVTVAMVQRLPVPRPSPGTREDACADAVAALADALARPACPDRVLLSARLQALVARLYGLTRDDLRHVLTTFPLVADEEKALVLSAFEREG